MPLKYSHLDFLRSQSQHEIAMTSFPMRSPTSNAQNHPASEKKRRLYTILRGHQQESRKTVTSHTTLPATLIGYKQISAHK